ncbi:hypothetical protein BDR07DRAFT_1494278 [Suillus spraguei]|nr:hypothetical protein BDR07DRAFT_1494278 [Suillus spraguei]
MSYWYGKVAQISLDTSQDAQNAWLKIRWYYRKVDLEDEGVDLAACIGEYELVLNHATILPYDEDDLTQPQIPTRTLYNRWTIEIKFSKSTNLAEEVHISNAQAASNCGCCRCDPGFSSPTNLQRYCKKCQKWFDEECVAALGHQMKKNVRAGLSPIYRDVYFEPKFLSLLTVPIRRGGSCGVVGNGLLLMQTDVLMDEAKMLGRLPEGWQDEIDQALLPKEDEIIPRYYCLTCTGVVI